MLKVFFPATNESTWDDQVALAEDFDQSLAITTSDRGTNYNVIRIERLLYVEAHIAIVCPITTVIGQITWVLDRGFDLIIIKMVKQKRVKKRLIAIEELGDDV